MLAAQLNKESTLLQRKRQLHFGETNTQVNLVKAAASAPANLREKQPEKTNKAESRKRKAEKSLSNDDILVLNVEKEDYCRPLVPSTSRQILFGPETPPKTPKKDWQKDAVSSELHRKSRREKSDKPKETKSSRQRHNSKKETPNPYVKLVKLDTNQIATALNHRSTSPIKTTASTRDVSPKPSAARTRGITSPDSSPEPVGKRSSPSKPL